MFLDIIEVHGGEDMDNVGYIKNNDNDEAMKFKLRVIFEKIQGDERLIDLVYRFVRNLSK